MNETINILALSKTIAEAWQAAANHEILSFEQITGLRQAMIIFDRIEQAGEDLQTFLGSGENDTT